MRRVHRRGAAGDCDSDICVEGRCSEGTSGDRCAGPADCQSGRCAGETCSDGGDGESCVSGMDCESGICLAEPDRSRCSAGDLDSPCATDADCAAGFECQFMVLYSSCQPDSCVEASDCPNGGCYQSECVRRGRFQACDSNPDCGRTFEGEDLSCVDGQCWLPGDRGDACSQDGRCRSNNCRSDGTCA